ncbi:hypothetical protein [Brevundimonas sp. Root1279]|uniref:hypothetical protein n=1 Tax=Brevundimonas sp. Root1279 TaxID=1736443 RepID=UPI000701F560|nr:hypothetical protein [Brevundimonas sp. Root1279]KQW82511.1 hypothetical protein ASC65_09815 [Brevundimonas sp. Root1279]
MTRRVIRADRLITVLGGAVLLLGVGVLWIVSQGGALGAQKVDPEARAQEQLRDLIGRHAVIRYTETGRRRAVCGYVSHSGQLTVFISRPNRILLETDPLKAEFDEMLRDLCPGFLVRANVARGRS